ncbi:MAG: hypothetical protein V1750_07335 [Acidobacteriota bacterium]
MWSLIKLAIVAVFFSAVAYGLFFVDLAGKPLFGHLTEVWRSPVVQAKVELVRLHLRNHIEDRLAAVAESQTRRAVRETLGPQPDQIDDRDRAKLNEIIADGE